MSEMSMTTLKKGFLLSEFFEALAIFEGVKVIEPEQRLQIALLYKIGFIEGIRAERAKRRRRSPASLSGLDFDGGMIRPFNESHDRELIIKRFKGMCQEHGVKATEILQKDARYNIDILCKDAKLFFVGGMDISGLVKVLRELPQTLEKFKDTGFVVFNGNGMPEDWKRSDK